MGDVITIQLELPLNQFCPLLSTIGLPVTAYGEADTRSLGALDASFDSRRFRPRARFVLLFFFYERRFQIYIKAIRDRT